MNEKEVMSPVEAAEYLRISKVTLYKLLKSGELPAVKVGYQWRITRAALDKFLKDDGAPEINWQSVDSRVRDGQFWGKWKYDAKRLALFYCKPNRRHPRYEIPLKQCCTASEVLNWIAHVSGKVSGKGWPTAEDIGYLVQALDEVLRLQSNLVHLPNGTRLDIKSHLKKRTKLG